MSIDTTRKTYPPRAIKFHEFFFHALAATACLAANPSRGRDLGIQAGGLRIHPYIEQRIAYDDDPGIARVNEEDREGFYSETEVGLRMQNQRRQTIAFEGDGWYGYQRNMENSDIKGDSYGQSFDLELGRRKRLMVNLSQSYSHENDFSSDISSTDYDAETEQETLADDDLADRYERTRIEVGALAAHDLSDKVPLEVSYGYEDYQRNRREFLDSTIQKAAADCGYRWTDKTTISLNGSTGVEDNESYRDPVAFHTGGIRLSRQLTDKTTSFITAGVESREGAESKAGDNEDDSDADDINSFVYRANLQWKLTAKSAITLYGSRSLRSSAISAGNTRIINMIGTAIAWRPIETMTFRMRFAYQNDDYQNPVQLSDSSRVYESRDIYRSSLGVSYQPPIEWLAFSLDGSYINEDSNIPGHGRDRKRMSASVTAIY